MNTKFLSFFDSYDWKVRFLPAIVFMIVLIFRLVGYHLLPTFESLDSYSYLFKMSFGIIGLPIFLMIVWPLSIIIAKCGDCIARLTFYNKNGFVLLPTTKKLLPKPANQLSKEDTKLRSIIKQKYDMDLLRHRKHTKEVVTDIEFIVRHIIADVRDDKMVMLNLISYGVMRNLIAVFFAMIFIELVLMSQSSIEAYSYTALILFIIVFLISLGMMRHYGNKYSDAVYTAYLSKNLK